MMTTNRMLKLCICLLLLAPLAAAAQTEVSRTVSAESDGRVEISNIAGSVVVTGWSQNQVEVTGTLGRGVEELQVETSGGTVEIEVELPRSSNNRNGDAHLEIKVPAGSSLEVETVSASITVSGVGGRLDLESVSGSVKVTGNPEEVEAESVSGSVTVHVDGAPVSVETVSGSIHLTGGRGMLDVESVSGSITVEASDLRQAELSSVSGRLEVSASLAGNAEVDIENHSGSTVLTLPASTSARFEVTTFSGSIDNELGPPAEKTGRYTPEKELRFKMGSGDAEVRIEGFSGSVKLRQQ